MTPYYSHAGITIYHGDCREVLPPLSGGATVAAQTPTSLDDGHYHGRG